MKRVYYNNDHILKEFFNEATVLPIPDEAPAEIPRIIIKTLHEHAQFSISPTLATFDVRYDNGFEKNWTKCAQYIEARMEKVFDFLNILTSNNYEYIGIVTNVIYDEIEQAGTKKISSTLLNASRINSIHDISIKYTFVEREQLFINILLQNARLFKQGIRTDEAGTLNEASQLSEPIGVIIDINDRFGFNNFIGYHSDSKNLKLLIDSMSNVINNKLSSLIEKGEY